MNLYSYIKAAPNLILFLIVNMIVIIEMTQLCGDFKIGDFIRVVGFVSSEKIFVTLWNIYDERN